MSNNKKYWKGLEDLNNDPAFLKKAHNEFAEEIPVEKFLGDESLNSTSTPRRDFLKFLGFSVTAASLAACETPVRNVIPYVVKPEEITPGVANWYASSYFDGQDYCSILVKTREGRPIKIEGNKSSKVTRGGTNARVQASVLSLYDSTRLSGPVAKKSPSSWSSIDADMKKNLEQISAAGGSIRILSSTIISPSTNKIIEEFTAKYPGTKQVTYDSVSYSGLLNANKQSFGQQVIPTYNFDKAKTIVSIGADFLGTWLSPVQFATQYAVNRKVSAKNPEMSKHYQVESNLTISGATADSRIVVKPSEIPHFVLNLYKALGGSASGKATQADKHIAHIAQELQAAKGTGLVICGSNDPMVQVVINEINSMIGSYGSTIDLSKPCYLRKGNDEEVVALIEEMRSGKVDALFMYNVNPVYTMPASLKFAEALSKVKLKVSFADRADETAELVDYICPDHNYLESWGDANPCKGSYSLIQPVIFPLFNTRSVPDTLLRWAGIESDYQTYVQKFWETTVFPGSGAGVFGDFWNKALFDGVVETDGQPMQVAAAPGANNIKDKEAAASETATSGAAPSIKTGASDAAAAINKTYNPGSAIELMLYEKVGIGNGSQANNPWLLELPDPISKVTWDNYITMNPSDMKGKFSTYVNADNRNADLADVTVNGLTVQLPVYPSPGQAKGTIGIAVGYGRTAAGKAANNIGKNVFPMQAVVNGAFSFAVPSVTISEKKGIYPVASTQTHHTLMGRDLVRETSLAEYKKDPRSGSEPVTFSVKDGHGHVAKRAHELDIWATEKHPNHPKPGHLWGMSIDLNSCIGCNACVISCHAENNVPVVGKKEVMMTRDMHWIRIDRYFSSDADPAEGHNAEKDYDAMEIPSDYPSVVFQPVTCMHCNHAPCETVCPVLATTHSSEGLNQMTYNRCVGTKYCANNCPYKVRRFNWFKYSDNDQFDYNMNDDLGKMVLNPDVVVRSRGVMEKCTMCVQRIQEGKLTAKKDGRRLRDGEIQTACAQACPTNAIVFGDQNDEESQIAALKKDERRYYMLEELDTQPNVFYLTKVKNENGKHA